MVVEVVVAEEDPSGLTERDVGELEARSGLEGDSDKEAEAIIFEEDEEVSRRIVF